LGCNGPGAVALQKDRNAQLLQISRQTESRVMVAFSSSRRCLPKTAVPKQLSVEALADCRAGQPPAGGFEAVASRRSAPGVEVLHDGENEIVQVHIGRWRVLNAGPQRRIAEVRQLHGDQVAVRLERFADNTAHPSSEIWQLYDRQGRLEAAMQSGLDGRFAMLTNYVTRQGCRLVKNTRGELEAVEQWTF
jgi:hypothetical protein